MPITVGSVGDIISVSLLVKDLLIALNDSRGSAAEYQALTRELYILDTALLQVEQLSRSHAATPELYALYETAKQTATKCQESVAGFTARITKYGGSFAVGGSGNALKDAARKIQWRASQKGAEIAKFRAEVTGYSESINMLLATGMVKLLNTNSDHIKNQLAEDGRRTHAALDTHTHALTEVRIRLDDNKQLISAGNSMASRMMDRLEWLQKLGTELKRFMSDIITGNIAIYREIVALRSAFSKQVDRPLTEDPFMLEDAIGRIAPVHLRFINSWSAFQAVMEIRFEGKQGVLKICRKEYILQDMATGREVDMSLNFEDAFLPGQKVTMSLVFRHTSSEHTAQTTTTCPRCKTPSGQSTDIDVSCASCNIWFRRITEIHEVGLPRPTARNAKAQFGKSSFEPVKFGPNPLRRKLEEIDGEDGDYSRFKRIRVVSQARRIKVSKTFTDSKKTSAFDTSASSAKVASEASKAKTFESATGKGTPVTGETFYFHGLVEEDTFELARSKQNCSSNDMDECAIKSPEVSGPELQAALTPNVQLMLQRSANNNARIGHLGNELRAASFGGNLQEVELLLDRGADVNARQHSGGALQGASFGGHWRIVKLLLSAGADVDAQGGSVGSSLQAASLRGHTGIVKLLLDAGANVNARGRNRTALQEASSAGYIQTVQLLLDAGADMTMQGRPFGNALEAAACGGHYHVVKLLLDKGADANARGGPKGNALQAALNRGHKHIVKLLLDKDAEVAAQMLLNKDN